MNKAILWSGNDDDEHISKVRKSLDEQTQIGVDPILDT
jgi:hypothetical protein